MELKEKHPKLYKALKYFGIYLLAYIVIELFLLFWAFAGYTILDIEWDTLMYSFGYMQIPIPFINIIMTFIIYNLFKQ